MNNLLIWTWDQLRTLTGQIFALVLGLIIILAVFGACGAINVSEKDSAVGPSAEPTIVITEP